MNSICVFCGSSLGNDPIYKQIAQATGQAIAEQGLTLVYGGGRSGLMGVVADSAIQAGGQVIGVIPNALVDRELAHTGLTALHVVNDMHERKTKMAELQTEYNSLDYARKRALEYPSVQDFMEAYTEKEIGGDSTKWDAYKTAYNKVRSDNPKG